MIIETKKNIIELEKKFREIKKQGWIAAKVNGTGSVGITFEKLLGKESENFEIPDYGKIEIKTKRKNSIYKTTLFHATPDNNFFETIRLCKQYGYPDQTFPKYNILNVSSCATKKVTVARKYKFLIKVHKINKRVYLLIFDKKNNLLEKQVSWSFEMLEEKLSRKLKILAFIKAKKKVINSIEHFYYDEISFYELKDFDTFIKLIENGKIIITFQIGIFKKGPFLGKTHDHGTGFSIAEEDLELLYQKIEINKIKNPINKGS